MKRLLLVCIFGPGLALTLLALLHGWLPTYAYSTATARYVAIDGSDTGDCATIDGRCRTIQFAVNAASPFDEIWVSGGTYTGTGPEVISVTKSITLLGGWDGASVGVRDPATYPVVLDGEDTRRVIAMSGNISPTVDGFVIARGNAANAPNGIGKGGGIYSDHASPVVANNIITHNVAYTSTNSIGYGGGIYATGSPFRAVITGNEVLFNVASTAYMGYGGGIYIYGGSGNQIINNVVLSNTASITGGLGHGGGIGFAYSLNDIVTGNRVEGNIAQGGTATTFGSHGGGVYCLSSVAATISGNIIQYNIASVPANGAGGGVDASGCHQLAVVDNILQGNIGSASTTDGGGRGGALAASGSRDLWLDGNWVLSNTASYAPWGWGGGLYLMRRTSFTMTNNIIAANHANYQGGGLAFETSVTQLVTGVLAHNTLAGNDRGNGDGRIAIYLNDPYVTLALTNNIIYSHTYGLYATENSTATLDHTLFYSNASGDTGGAGFVANTDPMTGRNPLLSTNYHLLPGSPAINAGVALPWVVTDIDRQSRPEGTTPDIGADEHREWRIFLPLVVRLGLTVISTRNAQAIPLTTYTVNSADDVDDGACNSTHCSLREAIIAANDNPGADTIAFNIPGAGVHTIAPLTALPPLTDGATTINGYSQPSAEPANDETSATILIEINGTNTTNQSGLVITSTNNVIRGLAINRFDLDGIGIGLETATGNVIAGNHLGVDPNGMIDRGNGHSGVFVGLGATNNTIGGDEPAERNVLSANAWAGVEIHGSGTMSNTISGNYIGTAASGMAALGNTLYGVRIYGGAQNNIIGGDRGSTTTLAKRNVISGNGANGVHIVGENTSGNVVSGNHIGTTVYGIAAIGNAEEGVYIALGAHANTIGGDSEAERNIISGNLDNGVYITGTTTLSNTISGNYIGTDATGTVSLGNVEGGVYIRGGAQHNSIGGDAIGKWNLISGNQDHGIRIRDVGTIRNVVWNNFVGTDRAGAAPLGNASCGVYLEDGASESIIWHNLISANRGGICLGGTATMSNTIFGNRIGTNVTGTAPLSNTLVGIYLLNGAHHNTVGGTYLQWNIISGNGGSGVIISGTGTANNTVLGNLIGGAADGLTLMGNAEHGVLITAGAQDNIIGPENAIVGNMLNGVVVEGSATSGNRITQNGILSNTLGIHLIDGANGGIAAPVITMVSGGSDLMTIEGTACSGCTVEVFGNINDDGEGISYLGGAVAVGGNFSLTEDSHNLHYLTATATDAALGTSEFSAVYRVPYWVYLPLLMR